MKQKKSNLNIPDLSKAIVGEVLIKDTDFLRDVIPENRIGSESKKYLP